MNPRRPRRGRAACIATLVFAAVVPIGTRAEATPSSRFREVDRLPVFTDGTPTVPAAAGDRSGWLILNPATRRGYQVFEATPSQTVIQSFDLDTLAPRRRVVLAGFPVVGGTTWPSPPGSTYAAGEVVHAVDREVGRIYIAMSSFEARHVPEHIARVGSSFRRPVTRLVAIDELALDRGDAAFAASFGSPAGHTALRAYDLMGMTVSRHHVAAGAPGKLLVLFASPNPGFAGAASEAHNHWLAQWNPAGLTYRPGAEADGEATVLDAVQDDWNGPYPLRSCALSPMTEPHATGSGHLQWGILPLARSVWIGCQAGDRNPSAVKVWLDGAGEPTGDEESYSLWSTPSYLPLRPYAGAAAFDVLVDPVGGRMVFGTITGNPTPGRGVIVFDTLTRSQSAPTLVAHDYAVPAALGLDEMSGTVYALVSDHAVGSEPFQGGLLAVSTRDGVPTVANVRPDLDYPAFMRIQIDPVTNRFFVRRGSAFRPQKAEYPGTTADTPAPVEPFYRVFVDKAA